MKIGKWEVPPENGARRTLRRFAFFPRCCDDHTVRWLEMVRVNQSYVACYDGGWLTDSVTPERAA